MIRAVGLLLAVLCSACAASPGGMDYDVAPNNTPWSVFGGDAGGKHYSTANQINRQNVRYLQKAWQFNYGKTLSSAGFSAQSTPILTPKAAGESLVFCSPDNRVIALDPIDGVLRWEFDPKIDKRGERAFRCRGLTYADVDSLDCPQRLYLASHDRRLIAINANNGKRCDGFGRAGEVTLFGFDPDDPAAVSNSSPPALINGTLVVGSTVVDFARANAPRGVVQAFDVASGAEQWRFDPLLQAGSGGANVWAPISVDSIHNLVFLPTSAPSPDYYGVHRPGNNDYANSVVALDAHSGDVVWSFQHVHHDLWDYDTPAQPILFDWQGTPALAQLTKQGFVFVLDRITGKPLFPVHETPVPASQIEGEQAALTQPKPLLPPQLIDPFLTPDQAFGLTPFDRASCRRKLEQLVDIGLFTPINTKPTLLYPGSLGGSNWGGGALLPSGVLITNVNNVPFVGQLLNQEQTAVVETPQAGRAMHVAMQDTPYTLKIEALNSFLGIPCSQPPWGKLVAIDLIQGKILWQQALGSVHDMAPISLPFDIDWGTPNLGGGIATEGGLFFIGATMDRRFRAFNTDTGEVLWQTDLPFDGTAIPMTYTLAGRQFVVINAGGHHMFGRKQGDALIAFALPEVSP